MGTVPKPKTVTNIDRLRSIIELRRPVQRVHGRDLDIPRPEVLRSLALGTDESRGVLKQIWDSLDERQQNKLRAEIVQSMPNAQNPTGIYPKGHPLAGQPAYSVDAQKILDVVDGEGLDAASKEVVDKTSKSLVPEAPSERGPSILATGGSEPSYVPDSTNTKATTLERDGAFSREAAEDELAPSPLKRPEKPKSLDAKKSKVKDPSSKNSTASVEDREPLRVDHDVTVVDGVPVRSVVEGSERYGQRDAGPIKVGREYEDSMNQRASLQLEMLVSLEGSQENVVALFRKAAEGDAEAKAKIAAVKTIVEKQIPQPKKPYPVGDGPKGVELVSTETTPQDTFDRYGRDLIFGNPTSPLYAPKRGQHDTAMEAWRALQIRNGGKSPLGPNAVFNSPREMAEQYVRNMSQEIFDTMPLTPSQRMDAADTVRQMDATTPGTAKTYLDTFNKDLPLRAGDRAAVRNQAIERLTKVFEDRFGSQWGENYKPTTVPKDSPSGPVSSEPDAPVSTSQDPNAIPQEGGVPNKAGTKPTAPTASPLAETITDNEALRNSPDVDQWIQKQLDEANAQADAADAAKEGKKEKTSKPWSQMTPAEQHASGYKDEKAWMADQNRRTRMVSDEDLARREKGIEEASGHMPDIAGAGRTSEILKEIDRLNGELTDYPPEIVKLQDELQAEGLTPARAKEIRDQLKPMYTAHEQATSGHEARLRELESELVKAERADKATGILSAKRTPLGSKVKKAKEEGINPADTTPVQTTQSKALGEEDAAAIESRPGPAPQAPEPTPQQPGLIPTGPERAMDDMPNFRRQESPGYGLTTTDQIPSAEQLQELDEAGALGFGRQEPSGTAGPDPIEARPIDPLESAAASPMDEVIDAEFEVKPDAPNSRKPEEPPRAIEQEAAARADEVEAPKDAASSRPAQEAETIPPDAGNPQTAKDKAVPGGPTKVTKQDSILTYPYRHPYRTAAAAGIGMVGLLGTLARMGSTVSQPNASADDMVGGGSNGGPDGMPGAGVGGAIPEGDPLGVSTADRIRMIQGLRGRVPTGIPHTAQQWR